MDPDRVQQARADESEHYNKIGVYVDPGPDVGQFSEDGAEAHGGQMVGHGQR